MLGTIPSVHEGKLFSLAGGRAEDIDRARVVLDKLTRRITHMGPHGSGYAMKLAVNLGLGAYIQALSESLALGTKQGLSLDQMLDVLKEAPTATGWLHSKIPVLLGAPADVTLDIRTMRKDIMSAVATGARSGVPMPLSAGTLASFSAAVAGGAGDGDLGISPSLCAKRWCRTSNSLGVAWNEPERIIPLDRAHVDLAQSAGAKPAHVLLSASERKVCSEQDLSCWHQRQQRRERMGIG